MGRIVVIFIIIVIAVVSYYFIQGNTNTGTPVDNKPQSSVISTVEDNKPPQIVISALEENIHQLINVERTKAGLSSLALDTNLSNVARNHSIDMAERNYFEHDTPEGVTPVERCKRGGVKISETLSSTVGNTSYFNLGCAENIFQGNLVKSTHYINGKYSYSDYNTQEEIAKQTVTGWMNSTGHRENILTPYWKQEGIGVSISENGEVYVTQDFN
ncbi:MAG: CAP domain-containing protein [Dehalococcoidia bacterium]|jgi:uncharacterized protein YkwD